MKRIRKICAGIISLSLMLSFTACEKAKKDNIADDLKENVGVEASVSDAENQNATDEIPENISYTVEVGGHAIEVDAKIYADGYGNIPTLAMKRCDNEDEWVLKYAKKLFDNGEYENVRPYRAMNREELESELQFFREKYESEEHNPNDETELIQSFLENYNEENYEKYSDDKIVYSFVEQTADEGEYTSVTNEAYLRGYVDGRMWTLKYWNEYGDYIVDGEIIDSKENMPFLMAQCIDDGYSTKDAANIDETYLNNLCDREIVEKQAKEFLEKLGFGNMELLHIVQNSLETTEEALAVDGYTMVFGMSKNEAHLLFACGAAENAMEPMSDYVALQPYVEVQVNSNGIHSIEIFGDYNETEVMSGESRMLSFEQINKVAKEEFEKMLTENNSYYFTVGYIEFGYVCITYDGLSYALVPAWRYYDSDSDRNTTFRKSYLTICALDGSVIYSGMTANHFPGAVLY
ncbi:MAG: hypothetical protein K2G45_08900 [Lachnospiraceae bacterium]|nr:hypothetical protein [Lachnospiraceae bacterium]